MYLIGISGAIGHGKTSLAQSFEQFVPGYLQLESGQLVAELANAWQAKLVEPPDYNDINAINDWLGQLPPLIKIILNVDCLATQLEIKQTDFHRYPQEYTKFLTYLKALAKNPAMAKTQITAINKADYRPLLQWLGGFLVERIGDDIWYNQLIKQAQSAPQANLCTIGGLRYPKDASIVRAAGGVIVKVVRPDMAEADLQDPTEQQRQAIQPDVTIINNGSLDELTAVAKVFYDDLKTGQPKATYKAI